MNKQLLSLLTLALGLISTTAFGQLFYSNGATIQVTIGGLLHINGDAETNGAAATLGNEGRINVANSVANGNFTINNTSTVSGNGDYYVEGDWTNNATFQTDSSYVNLSGGNQLITGANQTTFWDLEISGTGVKTQTLDAFTSNSLQLNSLELATDVNTMFVTTNNPAAVMNNNTFGSEGFVSSLAGGSLSRNTNQAMKYFFPTGSSLGTLRYRPAYITPVSTAANTYTARLANNDGTADGYPTNQVESSLASASANTAFYHVINRSAGMDNASIELHYDPAADGVFSSMGQWNTPTTGFWNEIGTSAHTAGTNYNNINAPAWADWTEEPFVLIQAEGIDVPNVFTPNGDGRNDFLTIPGGGILEYELVIYNRWGQTIFSTTAREINWDGRTTAGVEASAGTYYYTLKATGLSGTDYSQVGHITLLRD